MKTLRRRLLAYIRAASYRELRIIEAFIEHLTRR